MIVLAGGIEIGYDDVGTGVPVVFLHGFPHHRELWAPQLHALVDRARCIAPDIRGFGETTAMPPWSMDQYADDLAAFLDAIHVPNAVVAGLSMGGYVAFAFWHRHRHRVRALVLADTRPGADDEAARKKRSDMIVLARERGSGAVAEALITGMVGKSTRAKQPDIADSVHRMLAAAPVAGVIGALEAMRSRGDSTDLLATIDVPVLIVVGEEDVITPVPEARAMQQGIRGSRLEIIASAGHVSNMERPGAFNHVLSEFLSQLTLE